jgi:hypothetical protein
MPSLAITQHGWLPEIPPTDALYPLPEFSPLCDGIFHVFTHFIHRRRFNQRADDNAVVKTIPDLERLHRIGKFIHKLVIDVS